MLDYGARHYDPVIGRWDKPDPLAEKSRRWSPYAYCYNNPLRFVDPDGMWAFDMDDYQMDDDDDPKKKAKSRFGQLWDSFWQQFSLTDNKDELYDNYDKGDKMAIEEVERREKANKMASMLDDMEVNPYVSISLGKETSPGKFPASRWTGVTLTKDGLYFNLGGDVTYGMSGLFTKTSVSVSLGVTLDFDKKSRQSTVGIFNPGGGLNSLIKGDLSVGAGGGSFVGVSGSTTNLPFINKPSYSFGVTFTNAPLWISGNAGYMVPLITW